MLKGNSPLFACAGKVQHLSHTAAEKHRRGLGRRKAKNPGREMHVYRCECCGYWHVGGSQR